MTICPRSNNRIPNEPYFHVTLTLRFRKGAKEVVAQWAILRSRKRPGVLSCAVRGVRNARKTVQWTVFSGERAAAPGTRNAARGARANPCRNKQWVAYKNGRNEFFRSFVFYVPTISNVSGGRSVTVGTGCLSQFSKKT